MHILFLTNYFPPEIGAGAQSPLELSESLVKKGHQVTVVTGFPRYNLKSLPAKYRWRLWKREQLNGVNVLRINGPNFYGPSSLSRKLVQLLAPPVLGVRGLLAKKPDVVYTVTPPILMGHAAIRVARWHKVPAVVNVQDLFPQTLIDLGLLQGARMIRMFESWERYVYHNASAITLMSDGNRDFVINRGAPPENAHTVFNWVDTTSIKPENRINDFRRESRLPEDKFVVCFAGTMGASQDFDVILKAAARLKNRDDIVFLLVGEGTARPALERDASGMANVQFLPMQPKEVYPSLLAASDACLVTLLPSVKTPTVPSKICTMMAAGRPILATLPPGDAPRLIEEAQAGIVMPAADDAALADAIVKLEADAGLAKSFGESGRAYAEKHLSQDASLQRLEEILNAVVERHKKASTK
jgi:glycosyltransferase involved in cell wall biosynthesis